MLCCFLRKSFRVLRCSFSLKLTIYSPQCQPKTIAHLCKLCEVSTLFYDQVYQDLALSAAKTSTSSLVAHMLPWQQTKTPLTWIIKNTPLNLNHTPVHKSTSKS